MFAMNCPNCGTESLVEARFCMACATELTLAEESTTPRVDGLPTFQGFVGRQRELAELNAALGYAVSGQGRLVWRIGKRAVVCP